MKPDYFAARASSKTFLIESRTPTFMKNPIIPITATFQYKIPSLRTLTVMDTISWSPGDVRVERVVDLEAGIPQLMRCEHFLPHHWPGPLDKLVLKTVQWNVIIVIIIIIIIVVELLLLLSTMILIIGLLVLRPSTSSLLQSAIGIIKVRPNKPSTNSK